MAVFVDPISTEPYSGNEIKSKKFGILKNILTFKLKIPL
jgi:hypothetical protein